MKKYLWFLGLLMIGCGNAQNPSDMISGTWYLERLQDNGAEITIVRGEESAFILFEQDSMNGNAGCNRFFGTYAIKSDELFTSNVGMTRMLCPQAQMEIEDILIKILSDGVSSMHISGNELILQKSSTQAIFRR